MPPRLHLLPCALSGLRRFGLSLAHRLTQRAQILLGGGGVGAEPFVLLQRDQPRLELLTFTHFVGQASTRLALGCPSPLHLRSRRLEGRLQPRRLGRPLRQRRLTRLLPRLLAHPERAGQPRRLRPEGFYDGALLSERRRRRRPLRRRRRALRRSRSSSRRAGGGRPSSALALAGRASTASARTARGGSSRARLPGATSPRRARRP